MRLGFGEILVILIIALLLFGPTKLPQLGDALGKGIRNFKKATEGTDSDEHEREKPSPAQLATGSTSAHQTQVNNESRKV